MIALIPVKIRYMYKVSLLALLFVYCSSVYGEQLTFVHEKDGTSHLIKKDNNKKTGTFIKFTHIKVDDKVIHLKTPDISQSKYTMFKKWQSGIQENWFKLNNTYQVTLTVDTSLIKQDAKTLAINYDIESAKPDAMIFVGEYGKYPVKSHPDSEAIVFNDAPVMLTNTCQIIPYNENKQKQQHQFSAHIPPGQKEFSLAMTFHIDDKQRKQVLFHPIDLIKTNNEIIVGDFNKPVTVYHNQNGIYQFKQSLDDYNYEDSIIENMASNGIQLVIGVNDFPNNNLFLYKRKNDQWKFQNRLLTKSEQKVWSFGTVFLIDNETIYTAYQNGIKNKLVSFKNENQQWQENHILSFPFIDNHSYIVDFKKNNDYLVVALTKKIMIYRHQQDWQLIDTIEMNSKFNLRTEHIALSNNDVLAVSGQEENVSGFSKNNDFVLLFKPDTKKKWKHIKTLKPNLSDQNTAVELNRFPLNFGEQVLISDKRIFVASPGQRTQSEMLNSDTENCYFSDSRGTIYDFKNHKNEWYLHKIMKAEQLGFDLSQPTIDGKELYYIETNHHSASLKQINFSLNDTMASYPIKIKTH